jgi:hypothetical protein
LEATMSDVASVLIFAGIIIFALGVLVTSRTRGKE